MVSFIVSKQAGDCHPARQCLLQLATVNFINDCSVSSHLQKWRCVQRLQIKNEKNTHTWGSELVSHLRLGLLFICYSLLLKELTCFPASILQYCPLGLKVDGHANMVWLKQDVLNLFMPSVSGLWYWTALISVMVHYIFGVFHSRENWHIPYMKTILIAALALKLRGHLFPVKAKEICNHC